MRQHSYPLLALVLGVLALGLGLVACDSANPVAPTGSTLFITANPTQIPLGGTSQLTVSGFKPDGNPLKPGTRIILETTNGTVAPSTIEADSNGRGTAVFTSDGTLPSGGADSVAGSVTVEATLVGGSSGGEGGAAGASVDIQVGEVKPTLTITVNPNTIGLGETATVSTIARDIDGSSLGAGGQVRLRTDLGTLDDENLVTDSNGEASTTLNAGDTPGTASIIGSVDSSDETEAVTVTIGETDETRPTLSITVTPSTLGLGEMAVVEVQARNADGSLYGQGGEVRLSTDLGALARDNLTTNSNGEASTKLNAGDTPGTATVTGSVDSSAEVTASVTIENQKPNLIVNANPDSIPLGPDNTSTITIIARDNNDLPLGRGLNIDVFTTLGSLEQSGQSVSSVTTNNSGRAELELVASGGESGTATVTAILGSSDATTTSVTIRGDVSDVDLIAPSTINLNADTILLQAQVLDNQNAPVSSVFVSFATEPAIGEFVSSAGDPTSSRVATNNQGIAQISLSYTLEDLNGLQVNNDDCDGPTSDGKQRFKVTVTAPTEGSPIERCQSIVVE